MGKCLLCIYIPQLVVFCIFGAFISFACFSRIPFSILLVCFPHPSVSATVAVFVKYNVMLSGVVKAFNLLGASNIHIDTHRVLFCRYENINRITYVFVI
jgi:hypothetical protein